MKRIILLLTLVSAIPVFAVDDTAAPVKKSAAAPVAKSAEPLTIPKAATPNGDGSFSYTDEQGKKWIYRSTPFGVVRSAAAEPRKPESAPPAPELTKVIDLGDSVRFERPTPFGVSVSVKKKSDLTDQERRIVESQKAPAQPASTAPASTPGSHD